MLRPIGHILEDVTNKVRILEKSLQTRICVYTRDYQKAGRLVL